MNPNDDQLWKRRFQLFLAIRLVGLATFLVGIAIALTGLVQPGGNKLIGGLLAVMGALAAVIAPRILRRGWERQDQ
jgi:hypothetical protein